MLDAVQQPFMITVMKQDHLSKGINIRVGARRIFRKRTGRESIQTNFSFPNFEK